MPVKVKHCRTNSEKQRCIGVCRLPAALAASFAWFRMSDTLRELISLGSDLQSTSICSRVSGKPFRRRRSRAESQNGFCCCHDAKHCSARLQKSRYMHVSVDLKDKCRE